MSPEGLTFPSLQDCQAVLEGRVFVPHRLVRSLKAAARDPHGPAALKVQAETADGRALQLGLRRCRVALVPADRRAMQKRVAVAAAEEARQTRRRSG